MRTLTLPLFLLTLATFASTIHAFAFKLVNKSGADLYVYTSADGPNCSDGFVGTCSSVMEVVRHGGTYTSPYTLRADAHGISVKAAWEPHSQANYRPNYQMEVSKKDGWLWYNFSAVEGNVFSGIPRTLAAPGCPDQAHCNRGSDNCNWFPIAGGGDGEIHVCTHVPDELVGTIGE